MSDPLPPSHARSRRQFFQVFAPRRPSPEIDQVDSLPAPESVPSETARSMLLHLSREAMACEFEIFFDPRLYPQGIDAADQALDRVGELEDQLTVYCDTSEVSLLNQRAFKSCIQVEKGLFELLQTAKNFSQMTGGAFDITAGPLSKVWGFYRRQGQMPADIQVHRALAQCGHSHLKLYPQDLAVSFEKPGMEINLGAIGKGYALDQCAERLAEAGVADALIHGGMSSVLARGSRQPSLPASNAETPTVSEAVPAGATETQASSEDSAPKAPEVSGWWVGLRHPLRPDVRLAEFCLRNQGLGTSGSGTQYFHHQGKRYGHIIDPRTGWPADEVLSATVIAPTATQSDALSTALYVLGLEKAHCFCSQHPDIKALLVTAGKREGEVHLHPINLKERDWRLLAPTEKSKD